MENIALEILNIIANKNYEAYIVGGYPRDKYLNIKSFDIDICTNMPIDELKKIFVVENETQFGSLKLIYKNYSFEVTLFRRDFYDNSRYPKIKYVNTLKEDLIRRDFTINMLCIDSKGKYVDCYNSLEDIDNKIIRCLTDSKEKLIEDPLRIVRALRFASDLDFNIEETLKQSIIELKYLLKNISQNRINKELEKVKNKEKFSKLLIELDLQDSFK